jgi:methyl-accepting chemotaxis protein
MSAPEDKSKRRLFRLLRRGSRGGPASERTVAEEGALWSAHERACGSVREAGDAAQRIASHVAKQRGTVDGLADRARATAARAQDLSTSFARITDAFARLELVALNAGLEGARLGESAGHALGLVSDEVKSHATRGTEASRELSHALGEVGTELVQVHGNLDRARDAASEIAQEAARVGGAAADAERALTELKDRLRKTTGSDPETARAIATASDHARALLGALGELNGMAPRSVVLAAMRPVLEPLLELLKDEEG